MPAEPQHVKWVQDKYAWDTETKTWAHDSSVVCFHFGKNEIRTVVIDGVLWFVANDIARE